MRTLLAVLIVLLGAVDTSAASPRDSDRDTLTGLGSLLVLVKVDDGARQRGLDVDAIANEIKSSLRRAGLTVHDSVPEARAKSESDLGILVADIELTDLPDRSGQLVYAIELEMKQMAKLIRDPDRRALAVTWSVSTVGTGPISSIDGAIEEMTRTFLVHYRAVNPTES